MTSRDELEWLAALAAAALPVLGWLALSLSRRRRAAASGWKAAAEKLGLSFWNSGGPLGLMISGPLKGFQISVDLYDAARGDQDLQRACTRIAVHTHGLIPSSISLGSESGWPAALRKPGSGENLKLGDAEFDARAHARGPEQHLIACLNQHARDRIQELLSLGAKLSDGKVVLEQRGMMDEQSVLSAVRAMVTVARCLLAVDIPSALAENARRDPVEGVRLRNLQMLQAHYRDTEWFRDAIEAALRDREPRLRLLAASAAGGAALTNALVGLAGDRDESVAQKVAEGLRNSRDPRAEAALLGLLEHSSSAVRCAAAVSLGRIGSIRAVEPLLPLTKGLLGGDLKEAARDAIHRIQARLGSAGEGRLSVSEVGEAGGLSLSPPASAVSVASEEAGLKNRS